MRESVRSIFQRKHFSTYLQNSTFNNCQKLLSHIFPCTLTLQARLGPQFFCGHTALVVAFGRPGALEGPRCDICHILHIMPLQNRNRSIVKYSLFSKVCICRPPLVSLPLPLAIYLYLEKYYLDPHSEYIIFF